MKKTPAAEAARKLFARPCTFLLAAAEADQFPSSKLPEIAFAGRSNAGKSSLINALTGRKNLARASRTPGRTQQIVFFDLAGKLMLADLPGYGHARAPRAEKDRWDRLVQDYLRMRPNLRCVCVLIDARRGITANDRAMMEFLDRAAASYQIVLTKADQIPAAGHAAMRKKTAALLAHHPAARGGVLITSVVKNFGIEELRLFLAAFAEG